MDRWEIRHAPNAEDPQRHLLLLRGGVADVAAVLKKFGALCGRPSSLDGGEFNLSFVLHNVTPPLREKLDDWLGKMSPKQAAPETISPPVPLDSPPATPLENPLPPMPSLAPPPIPLTPPPAPLTPPAPAVVDSPSLGIPSAAALPPPPDILPPIPLPPGDPAIPLPPPPPPPPPPPAKEPLISLGPDAAAPVVASSFPTELRMATPRPADPAVPPPPAAAPMALSPIAAALTEELRTDLTFETLQVGAYNRFAHAAAMSVVTSPGSMYNPLFLYGAPGTGKTHLLYSIANSMSKGLGSASLLMTSGSRLSRAVTTAVEGGSMAAIDKKVADSKSIFVDDIHLLALTDKNRDLIAKLFKSFFDRGQQVVITSMYPPKALGALEEALKFTFSKGWSVDLKIPNPSVQRELISAVNDRLGSQMSGDEIGQLADKLTMWGYPDVTLWIKRLATLRKSRAAAGQAAPLMDLLRLIYEPITLGSEAPPVSTAGASFTSPTAPAGSEALAVIVPKGQEGLGAYAANMFNEIGAKNGFTRTYAYKLVDTYDASQQVGVPFQIADMCNRVGVTRVLLVGPGPDSPLASRASEFGHAVRHILESAGAATGWIPHSQLQLPAHYLNAHLDFDK